MPEVTITIAGRDFVVACQDGEEPYLKTAAKMLDNEAKIMMEQVGRLPEGRMLLMAGLMLADRTVGLEDSQRELKDRVASLEQELEELKSAPAPEPERVEVAVIPDSVTDTLAEIAARAEALADSLEERVG